MARNPRTLLLPALLAALAPSAALAARTELPAAVELRDDLTVQTNLAGMFRAAADEFGVPEAVLLAVSFNAGQWFPADAVPGVHAPTEAGHMGLRVWDSGPSAELAADLLGVDVDEVLTDPAQNIRGGAAILSSYAAEISGRRVAAELSDDTAEAWWSAVAEYAGTDSTINAALFANHVFHAVETGLEGVDTRTQEWLYSPPQILPALIADWSIEAEGQYMAARTAAASSPQADYPSASWVPACSSNYSNYSRTAADIKYVVIHVAEGSYNGTISWIQNCSASVSAHYVVSKYGEVTQMVKEEDVAWHAGNWDYNYASVGIEHEGYTYTSSSFTDAMYKGSAALTANICERNGISKNRTYVIGHNEVPGCPSSGGGGSGCHTDPGPYWNWSYYMSLVGGSTGGGGGGGSTPTPTPSGGSLVGIIAEGDIYTGPRISGATVKISSASTTSDSNGYYSFSGLTGSSYTVTASASGYNTASRTCTMLPEPETWCSIALTKTGSGGSGGSSGGCEEGKHMAPQTLASTASTTPFSTVPFTALALLGGLALRGVTRRR